MQVRLVSLARLTNFFGGQPIFLKDTTWILDHMRSGTSPQHVLVNDRKLLGKSTVVLKNTSFF